MPLHSPSASVAGEGGWEQRGTQSLHFGSHRLQPAWYQSPKGKGSPEFPEGEESVLRDQTERWAFPEPLTQVSGSLRRVSVSL